MLTSANNADYADLDGVTISVDGVDCGSVASTTQGTDMNVYCPADSEMDIGSSSQRGLQGSTVTVSKASAFEYCGFDAYGYYTPDYVYSYTLE
jgi:hypothetical protein